MPRCVLHVISHSHWDREWYMPLEKHRRRLVKLLDDVLDVIERDPEFGSFHLDGQAIPLEDYLQIRPAARSRLQAAAQAGRLTVGPWYVLQDEFLTSAEAQVRNLLFGTRLAAEFGPVLRVGYLADAFGHIGQMPAILRGFGIDNAVFGRGLNRFNPEADPDQPDELRGYHSEVTWRGPDGSDVLAIYMANWYANAMDIPAEPEACAARFEAIRDACLRYATTPHLLLMNGCDHTPCQLNLSELLRIAREHLDDEILHSRLDHYAAAVREAAGELQVATGELRSEYTDGWGTLTNVLSARLYLKQANWRCQRELERYLEPLQALLLRLGHPADRDFRRYLWKLLLQNHPHDSICGCSVDPVHEEMQTRFDKVEQLAGQLSGESLAALAAHVDTSAAAEGEAVVVVYNPIAHDRSDIVRTTVDFPADVELGSVEVVDASGAPAAAWIEQDLGVVWDYRLPDDRFRVPFKARRLELAFRAEVPALGWATYRVRPSAVPQPEPEEREQLENEHLLVEVDELGGLSIVDKATGRRWEGLNRFEYSRDVGDEYNYRRGDDPHQAVIDGHREPVRATPVDQSCCGAAALAVLLEEGGDEQTVVVPYRLCLPSGARHVEVALTITNLDAADFRLRALFPTDAETDVASADGHFEVVQRRIQPWDGWQNPSNCQPCLQFVDVSDEQGGLAVANRGLPEYEVLRDGHNTIAVTVLRAVGRLGDWGDFPTPGAQCEGINRADYAVIPHAGPLESSGAAAEARAYNLPLRAAQTAAHAGDLPPSGAWLRLEPASLVLSALRVAEDRDTVVARFYNPYETPVEAVLDGRLVGRQARRCRLDEEQGEPLPVAGGRVRLSVGPKEIVTLELG